MARIGCQQVAMARTLILCGLLLLPALAASAEPMCSASNFDGCVADDDAALLQLRPARKMEVNASAGEEAEDGVPLPITSTVHAAVVPMVAGTAFPEGPVELAIAISGGGARSLSLAMGQLRALHHLGLLDKVDGLSVVSGGSWAGIPYMYADGTLNNLLGPATDPATLDMPTLGQTPARLGQGITKAPLTQLMMKNMLALPMDRVWVASLAEVILKPLKLFDLKTYKNGRGPLLAASAEAQEHVVKRNPKLLSAKFSVPRSGRPKTFVVNAALNPPADFISSGTAAVPVQVTPGYMGIPFYPNNAPSVFKPNCKEGQVCPDVCNWVGGGLVESFAALGPQPSPKAQTGGDEVTLSMAQYPLTLADALGWASADWNTFGGLPATVVPAGFVWPVVNNGLQSVKGCGTDGKKYELADAGSTDFTATLAMLTRGAKKLLWFVNTYEEIQDSFDWCSPDSQEAAVADGFDASKLIEYTVACLFGIGTMQAPYLCQQNQVFKREEFPPIACTLQTLKKGGKPAVARNSLDVLPNSYWGVKGGYKVDSLLFYLEKSTDFESSLPADTQAELAKGLQGPFPRYPCLGTTNLNKDSMIGYKPAQVNLLAAQGEYSILQNIDLYRDVMA